MVAPYVTSVSRYKITTWSRFDFVDEVGKKDITMQNKNHAACTVESNCWHSARSASRNCQLKIDVLPGGQTDNPLHWNVEQHKKTEYTQGPPRTCETEFADLGGAIPSTALSLSLS